MWKPVAHHIIRRPQQWSTLMALWDTGYPGHPHHPDLSPTLWTAESWTTQVLGSSCPNWTCASCRSEGHRDRRIQGRTMSTNCRSTEMQKSSLLPWPESCRTPPASSRIEKSFQDVVHSVDFGTPCVTSRHQEWIDKSHVEIKVILLEKGSHVCAHHNDYNTP